MLSLYVVYCVSLTTTMVSPRRGK